VHPQFPKLECFGGHALGEALRQGDLIQQPIGSSSVGHIFSAVRKKDRAHQAVTVPLLGARELPQRGLGEKVGFLGHIATPCFRWVGVAAALQLLPVWRRLGVAEVKGSEVARDFFGGAAKFFPLKLFKEEKFWGGAKTLGAGSLTAARGGVP
jgi:hypothetical protein